MINDKLCGTQRAEYNSKRANTDPNPIILHPLAAAAKRAAQAPQDASHISQTNIYYKTTNGKWYRHLDGDWRLCTHKTKIVKHISDYKQKQITPSKQDRLDRQAAEEQYKNCRQKNKIYIDISGVKLAETREKLGYSINAIAKKLRISHCTILRLEQLRSGNHTQSPHYTKYRDLLLLMSNNK